MYILVSLGKISIKNEERREYGNMWYPRQGQIIKALLVELYKAGGVAKPKEIYGKVATHFPELSEAALYYKVYGSTYKWQNRVRCAKQDLVQKGAIDNSIKGVWILTSEGQKKALELLHMRKAT
ncbi:hypothetical protein J2Z49_002858 [Desulfofundulus luciae]|uniref:Restriction system protein Mrr-like N-terminal domain-containing protein n=1 Tax=Desulfofundulus luciae TaxID=74702 RepID=A0ABU0B4T2_9FIRM|nr:winged helix-turn-helix domain-containing protein [Desulfofundulus luciae]MDQ0287727.1 hypothetical protein [Desulfofundulus luciae]